jgi:hypothetical protein
MNAMPRPVVLRPLLPIFLLLLIFTFFFFVVFVLLSLSRLVLPRGCGVFLLPHLGSVPGRSLVAPVADGAALAEEIASLVAVVENLGRRSFVPKEVGKARVGDDQVAVVIARGVPLNVAFQDPSMTCQSGCVSRYWRMTRAVKSATEGR